MALLRPMILSVMLALPEAVRQAGDTTAEPPSARWTMRVPLEDPFSHPERCWFWGESSLAN